MGLINLSINNITFGIQVYGAVHMLSNYKLIVIIN